MKKLIIVSLVFLAFCMTVSAQSGRRVKSSPAEPTATPQVQVTQEVRETNEIGYSESAPNAPRSISVRNRESKKSKKETKKETKSPAQTTDAKTASVNPDEEVINIETNLITVPVSV